jgi:hypothetical protein
MERFQAAACTSGRPASSLRSCRPSEQVFLASQRQQRAVRRQQAALAGMGISFTEDFDHLRAPPSPELVLPGHDYGLSVKQMQVLGLTSNDTSFAARLPEVRAVSAFRRRRPLLFCLLLLPQLKLMLGRCSWYLPY